MRSLLILPLLASANIYGVELESGDEHLSLLQHQARKVVGGEVETDDQLPPRLTRPRPPAIPGPPATAQRHHCLICSEKADPNFGFCGVTMQCVTGTRGETEPMTEACTHRRGATTKGECEALNPAPVAVAAPAQPQPKVAVAVEQEPQVMDGGMPPPQVMDGNPQMGGPQPVPEAPAIEWDYEDPAKWSRIRGAEQCGGGRQSPIDVNRHVHMQRQGAQVQAQYQPTQLRALENNGHTLKVDGTFGTLRTPRGVFTAQTIKFHFPSEHTFDGVNADGEMHIVHTLNNNPNVFAVLAVPLKVGRPLSYQFDALHAIGLYNYPDDARLQPGEKKTLTSTLNLQAALTPQLKGDFYTYDGSLTTPPCQQNVLWFVAATPMKVGWRMPTDFNLEFGKFGNNRPTQAGNNRPVKVTKFLQTGRPFAPEQDPPDDDDAQNQAPPQAPDQNNDDVLTGDEAQEQDDAECDPTTWCDVEGRDGTPLTNEDGQEILLDEDTAEAAQRSCGENEDCVAIVFQDNVWKAYSDFDGVGDLKGKVKPTAVAGDDDEDDAPGPPANVQKQQCLLCWRRGADNEDRFGFCGTTMQCKTGSRGETEPVEENCPGGRGRNTKDGCDTLADADADGEAAPPPVVDAVPDAPPPLGPPAEDQKDQCLRCWRRGPGNGMAATFGFCGVTMECKTGVRGQTEPVEENCPGGRGRNSKAGCETLFAAPQPLAP